MKSKITSIIMFFITITIIGASILIGLILWNELSEYLIADTSGEVEMFESGSIDDEIIEKSVETSETKKDTNPLIEKEETGESQNNKSSIVYRNLYYQLDKESKTIYKAIEKNKENMKSGTYKIELGNKFSDILSNENGQEKLGEYYQAAVSAYMYDNPGAFYLDTNKMYLNVEKTTKGASKTFNTYINAGDEENYLIEGFDSAEEVNEAVQKLEEIKEQIISKKTGSDYTDIAMVHDYLVDNLEYDRSISEDNIHNIYGALINKKCVCEGYAKAFKYLLDGIGIESTLVIGKGTNSSGQSENHAWNYVKLDENWYAVDTTWDDPIVIGGGRLTKDAKYKYFLKGEETIGKDHFPSGKFTENGKDFEYPSLSSSDY